MPKVFGWQQFTYLAVFIVLAVVATYFILKYVKDEKILAYVMKGIGGLLLACILFNRISICVRFESAWKLIPDTFCGMSSFVLSLAMIIGKRDNLVFHCICYLGFVGALITMIYPDFIGQASSIFYPPTISGLLHHSVMLYAIILMVITKYFVPTVKKWYVLPLGLCIIMSFGILLITAFKFDDAMHIFNPLVSDTILTWWFCAIIFFPVSFIIMAIFEYFNVWKKRKETIQ